EAGQLPLRPLRLEDAAGTVPTIAVCGCAGHLVARAIESPAVQPPHQRRPSDLEGQVRERDVAADRERLLEPARERPRRIAAPEDAPAVALRAVAGHAPHFRIRVVAGADGGGGGDDLEERGRRARRAAPQ